MLDQLTAALTAATLAPSFLAVAGALILAAGIEMGVRLASRLRGGAKPPRGEAWDE